jgi:hypothetical protein
VFIYFVIRIINEKENEYKFKVEMNAFIFSNRYRFDLLEGTHKIY